MTAVSAGAPRPGAPAPWASTKGPSRACDQGSGQKTRRNQILSAGCRPERLTRVTRQEEGGEGRPRSRRTGPQDTRCSPGVPRKRQAALCPVLRAAPPGPPAFTIRPSSQLAALPMSTQH